MKNLLYIVLAILLSSGLNAQTKGNYIVVTIEKKSSGQIHQNQTDYWIVNLSSWEDSNKEAVLPLYLTGFSATDYKECCSDKNLILFNVTNSESFDYEKGVLESQGKLKEIIANNRKKVQAVKKKWTNGEKERINIYLTPITGNFCFCKLTHKDDNAKIGYEGQAAIPVSEFSYDKNFWESKLSDGIQKFDYAGLPFMSLQTIQ